MKFNLVNGRKPVPVDVVLLARWYDDHGDDGETPYYCVVKWAKGSDGNFHWYGSGNGADPRSLYYEKIEEPDGWIEIE